MKNTLQQESGIPKGPFFDMQVNGFGGVDFQSGQMSLEDLKRVAREMRDRGIVKIFLTLITDEIDSLERKFRRIESFRQGDVLLKSFIAGYHLEGPYLSPIPGYRGAHPGDLMRPPDLGEFERLQTAAGGNIRLVTIAPELDGAAEFIRTLVRDGVHVAIGHSDASMNDIESAIESGARFCTHLGNGVPSKLDRHDNVIQRLLSEDALTACLIPDGIHLPPWFLKNLYRAKPEGKVLFTSDCMAAAGAPPGNYSLGGLDLVVGSDRIVRQPGSTLFAGSSLCLDEAPANLVEWLDIEHSQAVAMCGSAVAKAFGITLAD